MARYTKVLASTGGVCCTCEQQVGCDCHDTACAMECQSKADTATLCGFDELTTPTVPPKKYKKKFLFTPDVAPGSPADNEGMKACGNYLDDVCDLPPECQQSLSLAFEGDVPGIGHVISVGKFNYVSTAGGTATYKAQDLHTTVNGTDTETAIFVGGPNVRLHEGETIGININTDYAIGLQYNYVTWNEPVAGCVNSGHLFSGTSDVWDYTAEYNPAACLDGPVVADNSKRYDMVTAPCTANAVDPVSSSQPDFSLGPPGIYGAGISISTQDQVSTVWDGVGCIDLGGGVSRSVAGNISLLLSEEDTEDDAIARSNASKSWEGGPCATTTTFKTLRGAGEFTFGYRSVRTRATCGDTETPLIVGHTYQVTIHYKWRVLGSVGPYTDYGIDEITFLASATIQTTDWVDVPSEDNKEIQAAYCIVLDITGP